MKHNYKITGMTCNGCRAHVEKTLNEVEGVMHASINLEKAEAVIEMKSHIKLETFQEALHKESDRYSIMLPHEYSGHHQTPEKSKPTHFSAPRFFIEITSLPLLQHRCAKDLPLIPVLSSADVIIGSRQE